ncbi:replication initiation protein [Prosthecobacter vanneervenii]|uniref:Primase C-terminal 1 domain-containing protein n=1 Tax=Prosthecobacter vanneervenii TaxID=48466 RepID=A0A7W7YBG4_9BACT|nr:replication initiation protein [Prosthecobacter vanneervenii]MBB5033121.1 hypothetical protein [Prosthecobacter vanneervenii]
MIATQAMREVYLQTIPQRPYCTNHLGRRLRIIDAARAAGFANIQHNMPLVWHWLVFDIDGEDAYTRAETRGCPPPNFIALNPANGHGHAGYLLESAVTAFDTSSRRAIKFFEDVERGMTNRLGADHAYPGFLSKNPLCSRWETDWQAVRPYRLETLNDYLDKTDKRKKLAREMSAVGRNATLFEQLSKWAYRHWFRTAKEGRTRDEFECMLHELAEAINATFPVRLSHAEISGVTQSVARWVWKKFTLEGFAKIQRARALKRWAASPTLTAMRPWIEQGISRRTWERRRQRTVSP